MEFRRPVTKWVLLVLTLALISAMGANVVIANVHESSHHDHDSLSARVFWTSVEGRIVWADVLDGAVITEGSLTVPAFDRASVTSNGRFLGVWPQEDDVVHVFSSGLFFEEHGDHMDAVAVDPSHYWSVPLLAGANLHSGDGGWSVSYPQYASSAVIWAEQGTQTIFPDGGGQTALAGQILISVDSEFGLLDFFDTMRRERLASLRLPWLPEGMAAGSENVLLWKQEDLISVDLETYAVRNWTVADLGDILDVWQHSSTNWIYALTETGIAALAPSGEESHYQELSHTKVWSVDTEHHYLALVMEDDRTIQIMDVGHGGFRMGRVLALPQDAQLTDVGWAGSSLVVTAGQTIWIMDAHGALQDSMELDFHPAQVMVVELRHAEGDGTLNNHDHDHDHDAHSH